MKRNNLCLTLVLLYLTFGTATAQVPDFMDLASPNVELWTGHTPRMGTLKEVQHPTPQPNRHTEITVQGTDPITGGLLSFIPDGETKSIRLGNNLVNFEAEAIIYKFTVDKENPVLLLNFAVVLEDPGHPHVDQPRFIVRITDPTTGDLVDPCAEYDVSARPDIPGFQSHYPNGYVGDRNYTGAGAPIRWRDWTKVGLDLSRYARRQVQVEFITYDCNLGAHAGYCYFTAFCMPNRITVSKCLGATFDLHAPADFESYAWRVSGGDVVSTDSVATFNTQNTNLAQITCTVTSATGCQFTLYSYVDDSGFDNEEVVNLSAVVCEGEPYNNLEWNFYLPPQPAGDWSYQNVIVDPDGCITKLINLDLLVPARYIRFKESVCYGMPASLGNGFTYDGTTFSGNGFNYTNRLPGVYRDTIPVPGGGKDPSGTCDRFNILELIVSTSFEMPNLEIQGDGSPCTETYVTYSFPGAETLAFFEWDFSDFGDNVKIISGRYTPQITVYFTEAVSGEIRFNGRNGCGSGSRTLQVNPRKTQFTQLEGQVCVGDEFNMYNFNLGIQKEPGFFTHSKNLQTALGCDSTVLLMLTVLPMPVVRIEPADTLLCTPGEAVTLCALVDDMEMPNIDIWTDPDIVLCDTEPGDEYYDAPSVFIDDYASSAFIFDCDIEYEWAVASDPSNIISTDPCITVNPTVTTTYIATVTRGGCPTTVSQTVTVKSVNPIEVYETICYGETYTGYGLEKTESGDYQVIIEGKDCNQIINVHLTVRPKIETIINGGNICAGDRYTANGFDIEVFGDGPWEETRYFYSSTGCDSTVILRLNVFPKKTTVFRDTVCQYSTYDKYNFDLPVQNFAGTQTHYQYLSTPQTCDSTVILYLLVTPLYKPDFYVHAACEGVTTFTNASLNYDEENILCWEWYLNDEQEPFATTEHASRILTPNVSYSVTLKVITKDGKNGGCVGQKTLAFTADEDCDCPCRDFLIWTGAQSSDWNDYRNWLLADPWDITPGLNNWDEPEVLGASDAASKYCTNVWIPRTVASGNYPDLTPGVTDYSNPCYRTAACKNIWFAHGGEVARTDSLHYERAHVELGLEPDRWMMLSAPLRYMVAGDYWKIDPCPYGDLFRTYTQLFVTANPQQIELRDLNPVGEWSGSFNNPEISMKAGFGMGVWTDDDTYGGDAIRDDGGKQTIWHPKQVERYNIYRTGTCDVVRQAPVLDRTQAVMEEFLHHRFIYEPVLNSLDGNITLTTTGASAADKMLIVGNPFMAHWDFDQFATAAGNSDLIKNEYYVLERGNDNTSEGAFTLHSPLLSSNPALDPDCDWTTHKLLPPMQSVVVVAKKAFGADFGGNDLIANVLQAKLYPGGNVNNSGILRSANTETNSGLLKILAKKNGVENQTYTLFNKQASNNYLLEEDSYKLFHDGYESSIAIYTRSTDGVALEINSFSDTGQMIPLGVRTSETGTINLSFAGLETFMPEYDIFLIDTDNPSVKVDLKNETPAYSFEKTSKELFMDNRIFLSFKKTPAGISTPENNAITISTKGTQLQVISDSNIENVTVFDMQGRTIVKATDVENTVYSIDLVMRNSMYVVKVLTDNGLTVKKVITAN